VRLLLDTHVVLWWLQNSPRLGAARRAITEADTVFVSAASAWEVAVKIALGRLQLPADFAEGVEKSQMRELPIRFPHAAEAGSLPAHHTDPFDRMLVAQARREGLTLVTHDRLLEPYEVPILWVR
jgi:PIN domain nuclease of toxin-antitoxin system